MAEMVSEEAKSQVAGITLIADANGFGFKHVRNFGLTDAKTMSAFLQTSFPLWFRDIHVINAPRLFFIVSINSLKFYIFSDIYLHFLGI